MILKLISEEFYVAKCPQTQLLFFKFASPSGVFLPLQVDYHFMAQMMITVINFIMISTNIPLLSEAAEGMLDLQLSIFVHCILVM